MTTPSQAEVRLVHALQSGQVKAFTELYNAYSPTLYNVLARMVGDQTNTDDLLQNVFIRIWMSIHRYDPDQGRLFTWLMTITRNVALDEIRTRKCQVQLKTFIQKRATQPIYSTLTEGISNQSLFSLLTPKYRQIMELVYIHGWTKQEVAEELKLPLGTVKTRFRTALLELKQVFSQDIYHYHLV